MSNMQGFIFTYHNPLREFAVVDGSFFCDSSSIPSCL